jgi:hypothetical protein
MSEATPPAAPTQIPSHPEGVAHKPLANGFELRRSGISLNAERPSCPPQRLLVDEERLTIIAALLFIGAGRQGWGGGRTSKVEA